MGSHHHRNAKEARFIGNGNIWVGGLRGWQVKCSRCSQTKTINSHGRSSLPPPALIKKLSMSGWHIGNKPEEDVCKECLRKPAMPQPKERVEFAKKALADVVAPMVESNGKRVHFNDVVSVAKTLEPEQAKELMKVLRGQLPQKQPPKPKPPKPLPESDASYEQWLSEQDKT